MNTPQKWKWDDESAAQAARLYLDGVPAKVIAAALGSESCRPTPLAVIGKMGRMGIVHAAPGRSNATKEKRAEARKQRSAVEDIEALAATGMTAPQIARIVDRSVSLVEQHLTNWRQAERGTGDVRLDPQADARFVRKVLREAHRLGLAA